MKAAIIGNNQSINQCFGELLKGQHAFTYTCYQPADVISDLSAQTDHELELILIDLSISIKNSCDFVSQVHKLYPGIPIIALHFYKDRTLVEEFITAGASGYLLVNTSISEFSSAIGKIMNGEKYITRDID